MASSFVQPVQAPVHLSAKSWLSSLVNKSVHSTVYTSMSVTKVLLVEDEPNWLKIFEILVASHTNKFFDYVHGANLASAIEAIKTEQFGLILLDLMLPDSQPINTIQTI